MKKFAAFLMILSVSVFTMGCGGGDAKKKTTPKTPTTKTDGSKKTDGGKKAGSGDKKGGKKSGDKK